MKRKICVVTGSRADYGYLVELLRKLKGHEAFDLQIAVTGMHLAPDFGNTGTEILNDDFSITARVPMLGGGDSSVDIVESTGRGVTGFAPVWKKLQPDMVVIMGDRFEIFAAAQAAFLMGLTIAHLAGGDVTEGAFDDGLRHAMTKLSHIHFVTNEEAARRVRQMGEPADRIFTVGSTGLDAILKVPRMNKEELGEALGYPLRDRNLLVTYHPVTEQPGQSLAQFEELLLALEGLLPEVGLILTYPNADTEGRELIRRLEAFGQQWKSQVCLIRNLGLRRYASALSVVDAVVGNSSSGLYEAPSFDTPTVNIGDRQKGRLLASSVISCEPSKSSILEAIQKAFDFDCNDVVNPFGDGHASERIVNILSSIPDWSALRRKTFSLNG